MNPNHTLTDHDLLVRLDERVEQLLKWTNGHDKAHAKVRTSLIGAFVAILVTAIGVIMTHFYP